MYNALAPEALNSLVRNGAALRRTPAVDAALTKFDWLATEGPQGLVELREEVHEELEAYCTEEGLPYCSVPILRANREGKMDITGHLKCAVILCNPDSIDAQAEKEAAEAELKRLKEEYDGIGELAVRAHIVSAHGLMPRRISTPSEPAWCLRLSNGHTDQRGVHDVADRYHPATGLSPDFYRSFELDAVFPTNAILTVGIVSAAEAYGVKLAGRTYVDVEDRWFNSKWKDLANQKEGIPIELRVAREEGLKSNKFGTIRGWYEIYTRDAAARNPMQALALPTTEELQVRLVAWNVRGVSVAEGSSVSLYITTSMTNAAGEICVQDSDTHWNSSDGTAVFNWRFVFDVTVPARFPYVNVQLWNRNLLARHEAIAEVSVDLSADLFQVGR
eukprot:GHVU01118859.1.p1 GENE.GHVU01118859.1~~GHVU01118859.1.p1  ORF type:complete len:455 (+),score=117.35 GHVU01118859.1:200-1366(+)